MVSIVKLDSKDLNKSVYEMVGVDVSTDSPVFQEIVKIMKFDPIEKIKTSEKLSDVGEVLNLCREIAKAVLCSNSSLAKSIESSDLVLSGDVGLLIKVKLFAAFNLKKAIIDEATRNIQYINFINLNSNGDGSLWDAIREREGLM